MSSWFRTKGTKDTSAGSEEPATGATIYVRAVIDVAGVLQDFPDVTTDAETPTVVSFDGGQIIVTTTSGTVDQSTGDLTLNASLGDSVCFYAKSGSNNFEDAVLVQRLDQTVDEAVLEDAALLKLPQIEIAPAAQAGEQPAKSVEQDFWFWQCTVVGEGTQTFSLILALYDRDEAGQPRFAGLYRWDLQLTVLCSPPPDENTQQQERTP